MKKLLLPLLLMLVQLTYGQTNYYTFNNDSIVTEKSVRSGFETIVKSLPSGFTVVPTIYHKIIKKDSVINYLEFRAQRGEAGADMNFKFSFKQDSVFLLLGKKLPEFKLTDLQGNEFSSSQLIGKPALLNFWGILCSPCIAEIPELNGLKEKYSDKMFFLALTEKPNTDEQLITFLEKCPYNYHILKHADNYRKTLKIRSMPYNIFIDKDGYIRYIQRNFPYKAYDPQNGIKKYEDNNYFVKIIEELTKEQ
ncbi:TlpA family protein disulfide reductase [Solitalea lacus]|uniref:TlpA family protein disulfide reductase n=1 Tax=Solitalea lacus TaxID=2911172 RepID=UPI001EDB36F1|nr:TlpA disulfide reductase family protein [Solitalea lacus]UKJ07174.1 TlpA family protein disulfide reductase [Solitalea lacus]